MKLNNSKKTIESDKFAGFSPNNFFLGVIKGNLILLRYGENWSCYLVFNALEKVDRIEWASDSNHFLCIMRKNDIIKVFKSSEPNWNFVISDNIFGFSSALWVQNSLDFLTFFDCNVKGIVWRIDSSCSDPKGICSLIFPRCFAFNSSNSYMAVCVRRNLKEFISIYDCSIWFAVQDFTISTKNAGKIFWTLEEEAIIVCDSPLYHLLLVYGINGTLFRKIDFESEYLGIKSVLCNTKYTPYLAIELFDDTIHIINSLDWSKKYMMTKRNVFQAPLGDVNLFFEDSVGGKALKGIKKGSGLISSIEPFPYNLKLTFHPLVSEDSEIPTNGDGYTNPLKPTENFNINTGEKTCSFPFELEDVFSAINDENIKKADTIKLPELKLNVDLCLSNPNTQQNSSSSTFILSESTFLQISSCGRFLASSSELYPKVLWIWEEVPTVCENVLVFQSTITSFSWKPLNNTQGKNHDISLLIILTASERLFFWSPGYKPMCVKHSKGIFSSLTWKTDNELILSNSKNKKAFLLNLNVSRI